ncbi:MAG: replicative DNA helicase [Selenomonadaceae bacterium]|nr:replicative DNA helicase [Selenomonadaceae bacterium]
MNERVPPQNVDAERAVLCAMMIDPEAISKAHEILKPDDFYREAHRLTYIAMGDLAANNEGVDIVTLTEQLKKKEELDKVGGIAFVAALSNAVATAANVVYHAKIVREKSQLRHLIGAATEIAAQAYEGTDELENIMDDAERKIMNVTARDNADGFEHIKKIMLRTIDNIEKIYEANGGLTGISSGFKDLDTYTSGLQASDLILVAARPSMGKTAFTLNIASYAAIHGKTVAFFSLEMSKEQLVQRVISSEGTIEAQRFRTGEMTDEEWYRILDVAGQLSKAKLFIDDTPGITVMELRSRARRLMAEQGLDLIVIDYLQLMQGRAIGTGENRQQEISEISRSLKALARELNVPVIALSQLSRGVESRQVKRPMLSDLRESGSLEQDADIVMFLYREDYYDPATERKNITEVIIAKHRNGPIGTVELLFQKEFTKFRDLAYEQ